MHKLHQDVQTKRRGLAEAIAKKKGDKLFSGMTSRGSELCKELENQGRELFGYSTMDEKKIKKALPNIKKAGDAAKELITEAAKITRQLKTKSS